MKYILTGMFIAAIALSNAMSNAVKADSIFKWHQNPTDTTKKRGREAAFQYPDLATSDTAKKRFEKEFKKGKILYESNCAKCHNVKENNKMQIPDFSLPQLMDYEMRFQYPDHEEDLKETNITHDEIELVVQYLRYKIPSGIPYKILPSQNQ